MCEIGDFMEKQCELNIVTNDGVNISENILSLVIESIEGKFEILSNHANAIISTIPTVTKLIDREGNEKKFFTSTGIIYIENNSIRFCCDCVNYPEEIDLERAIEAKKRAEKRLLEKNNVDIERAKKALLRANARIEVKKYS